MHTHDHSHNHPDAPCAPANYNRAFAVGVALNVGFVVCEAVFGILADSMALLADAGHNLSDVLGLLLAWGASYLVRIQPTSRRTYGWRSSSIMAALINAVLLLVAVGGIATESIRRLTSPEPVAGKTVIVVALVGVVINTATALLFLSGRKKDLNIRGAFLHMAADAAVSAGVAAAGIAILMTGRAWIDPAVRLWNYLEIAPAIYPLGKIIPGRSCRRRGGARPSHLGHEHHRDGTDRPPGQAEPRKRR